MNNAHFITICDHATFQVSEIQAITLIAPDLKRPAMRVYLKGITEPFRFTFDTSKLALQTFDALTKYLDRL